MAGVPLPPRFLEGCEKKGVMGGGLCNDVKGMGFILPENGAMGGIFGKI